MISLAFYHITNKYTWIPPAKMLSFRCHSIFQVLLNNIFTIQCLDLRAILLLFVAHDALLSLLYIFNPLSFERIISYGSNTSFISQIYFLLQVWKRRKFKIQHLCGQFLVQHKKCWFTLENWVGGIFNTIFEKVHYISIQKSYCKLSSIPGISRIACLL